MPEATPNGGPDLVRCPRCSAGNPAGATWCGQCLQRFDDAVLPARSASTRSGATALRTAGAGPAVRTVEDGEPLWTCPACETENPLSASSCSRCGSKFVSFFGAAATSEPPRLSGSAAVAMSAALPGAGNWAYGQTGQAVARAVLYLWTVLLLLARPPVEARGLVRGVGAIFALAAVAVWLLSMIETLRLGHGDARPFVPPKALTWFSAGLSAVLMLGLLGAVIAGR